MTKHTQAPSRADLLAEAVSLRSKLSRVDSSHSSQDAIANKIDNSQPDLSVMFFSADSGNGTCSPYTLVLEAAKMADRVGMKALWLPERHFEPFGGPYPNPAVLAAAVARETQNIRIRAGSVILPLHDPIETTEAWAMVDQLSDGRVDLAFGSGWNTKDFSLRPENFTDNKGIMRKGIDEFCEMWSGGSVRRRDGKGNDVEITSYPKPRQNVPGIWIAATGSLDTFYWAGQAGFNVLTMVLGGSLEDIAEKIEIYRVSRKEAGFDPAGGHVTLMLHSYVDENRSRLLKRVRGPMTSYVRSALDLHVKTNIPEQTLDGGQRDQMADFAFERYLRSASLIGTPQEITDMLARVKKIGVNEVACLLDFGLPDNHVLEGLSKLIETAEGLKDFELHKVSDRYPDHNKAAILGIACRFPGASDFVTYVGNLKSEKLAIKEPPSNRWPTAKPALVRGGFIDLVEYFDSAPFRISPTEAAVMDPHQRLFLETVWQALEDAGLRPCDLRGQSIGVFVAMYSTSYLQRCTSNSDPLSVAGGLASMVANRTSFVFDWRGPSETVDTACSSGLVAVHRALRALRSGECDIAVVGGVSLLLSDVESTRLAALGVLAEDGRCRAFDVAASGQARGEGVAAVVLKRWDMAKRDGDRVHALVAGSAVNHAGGLAGSLTLPSSTSQAKTVVDAWKDAGLTPEETGYVEAHGAGTAHGDRSEISALRSAFSTMKAKAVDWTVGSVKPAIGSLDACGGIAGLISAVASVEYGFRPALLSLKTPAPDLAMDGSGLRLADKTEIWNDQFRTAAAHAYGLGGVAAHVVVENAPDVSFVKAKTDLPVICPVFGWDAAGLVRQRQRLAKWLFSNLDEDLYAVSSSLCLNREPMAMRWVAVVNTLPELASLLSDNAGPLAIASSVANDDLHIANAKAIINGVDPKKFSIKTHRVCLPSYSFAPTCFPIDGLPVASIRNGKRDEVARYYDYVTNAGSGRDGPIYLTLAPLPDVVPGFSWTRTMRDPNAHPEHAAMMRSAQLEMRKTLLADIAFEKVHRVLDIGCGFATDLIDLVTQHANLHGVGYTIAPAQAQMANSRVIAAGLSEKVQIFNRNSSTDLFPGFFDLAIGYEVGHHIEDKQGLFANLSQALRPGGKLALIDCAADTAKSIHLPEVGSWTSTLTEYADILAQHGFRLIRVIDASSEVGNFLVDPGLDSMLAGESGEGADLVAKVQYSWDGFGAALREGLIRYLLITAERLDEGAKPPVDWNRSSMGIER
ncbi:ptzB [Candidatus Endolissoclinum faulkneri L2]|uniref:PtzB n=1 Tax=Candidatus Endolissoclinum faulkneri L2 TaxID=1193729 RepID=K7ZDM8_9PROT|nr:MupA/Atu3671 family FMN-dependent luciferase-like monooxygenase [Candidatus Endolissoclinum faulkneri]AFX99666.1 ptzB [Candidatus Endolissoclinum faulkneri L2]